MKVSSSWIKDHLRRTMLTDQEIVQALERAGLEVEHINLSQEIDKRVVIGLTKKVIQHPGADRLKIVFTQVGEEEFQIVCGAPNVREGMRVALAQVGSTLPGGDQIKKAKLRGELSEGMLCSSRELGLGDNHDGILELPEDAKIGAPVASLYPADAVIDLKTPANRFDVQSIIGLAREVAAMTTAELVPLTPLASKIERSAEVIGADIEARRYMVGRISVAPEAPSARLLAARLQAVGIRSISPVVDVTNYVLCEVGQPMHAFDAAKVVLPLSVRLAQAGETLVTLDGVSRKLTADDLIVVDANGPVALAGVMGGLATEVTATTKEILLESAVFDAVRIRKTAQRHGLRTEASARYERGISPELPAYGLERAIALLAEYAGGRVEGIYEAPYSPAQAGHIELSLAHLSKLLGFGISYKEAVEYLAKLGIESVKPGAVGKTHNTSVDDEMIAVEVPWWRPDLKEAEDLVEEIVRVVGYDHVPATIPSWRPLEMKFDHERARRRLVRDVLWAAGGFEVMTYSFVSKDQLEAAGLEVAEHLKLKNPLSSEQAYLRSSLLPSHLTVLARNRLYSSSMSFYEVSKVFLKRAGSELPDEPLRLAVTVYEPTQAYRVAKGWLDGLAAALNIDLEIRPAERLPFAPGRYAEVWLGGTLLGGIGQINPHGMRSEKIDGEAAYFELDMEPLLAASSVRAYQPVVLYPSIKRDISLLVPQAVTWSEIAAAVSEWDVGFLSDYYGSELPDGKRGLTLRVRLALPDRTPTEAEATKLEDQVVSRLSRKLGILRRD